MRDHRMRGRRVISQKASLLVAQRRCGSRSGCTPSVIITTTTRRLPTMSGPMNSKRRAPSLRLPSHLPTPREGSRWDQRALGRPMDAALVVATGGASAARRRRSFTTETTRCTRAARCETGRSGSEMPAPPRMQGWPVGASVGHARCCLTLERQCRWGGEAVASLVTTREFVAHGRGRLPA
jgi:hypothetical protein